jgi:hypothetical protein
MAGKNVTTLSSKFQISVPKSVREQQKWKVGQKFAFVPSACHRGCYYRRERFGARANLLTRDKHFEGLAGVVHVAKGGLHSSEW